MIPTIPPMVIEIPRATPIHMATVGFLYVAPVPHTFSGPLDSPQCVKVGTLDGKWLTHGYACVTAPQCADRLQDIVLHRGNVCPARARRALGARPARYLSNNYPDFSPRFTL